MFFFKINIILFKNKSLARFKNDIMIKHDKII